MTRHNIRWLFFVFGVAAITALAMVGAAWRLAT